MLLTVTASNQVVASTVAAFTVVLPAAEFPANSPHRSRNSDTLFGLLSSAAKSPGRLSFKHERVDSALAS